LIVKCFQIKNYKNIKNLSEADPSVRDSSAEALGALLKALGEKIFLQNVGEVEQAKLDKV
jgi:cytoskeleton-associated protein 5